jgi:flagellum-specific peptidoglycan hydrolase FlgJ
MASPQQIAALAQVYASAQQSGCLFPQAQACEVMVETTWGTSQLFREDWNGFGMKQHQHPIFGTVNLPTKEFLNGKWVVQHDDFVKYPTMADCFADRMNTLRALAPHYPHYAAALVATNPEDFLTQVSRTWSTGPTRGAECIAILHAHSDVFMPGETNVKTSSE